MKTKRNSSPNLDYGVIGNGRSAALVSKQGTIDWCCLPAFDSPSVFARLLDTDKGGHFGISVKGRVKTTQRYLPHTNILVTHFQQTDSEFEVIDFMPRYVFEHAYICPPDIVRYIRVRAGTPKIVIEYCPKLGYAKTDTDTANRGEYLKSTMRSPSYESVYLYSDLELDSIANGRPVVLNDDAFLLMSYNEKIKAPHIKYVRLEFERTKLYWMNWIAESRIAGEWHDAIERSLLVLKLLAYQRTGAVLAAVTTGLPEEIGSDRNWDYRYCWLRDASMVIKIFCQLGHFRVGSRYLNFILDVISYKNEKVQIMYGIHRQKQLTESNLGWLAGYENSKPVRIGNAAYKQKQHDIFGFVLDTIYQRLLDDPKTVENIEGLWTVVRAMVRHVERNWRKPDAGIWEIRGERKHFVFSKVLCWVAIDRALKIAQFLGKTTYAKQRFALRERIYKEVLKKGWNEARQAFTQAYGDEHLDAANLLMEHYGMIAADDPKYISTVQRTYDELCHKGLMYRYKNRDDFGLPSSSFTVCTFWMIKSLHRIGQHDLARRMFEDILKNANHVGLFSEDMDFDSKRLLGNFPQGYSHLALIDTALTLSGITNGPTSNAP